MLCKQVSARSGTHMAGEGNAYVGFTICVAVC